MSGSDQGAQSFTEMFGLITGSWVSQIVRTAAALSVADHLADQPMSARELASVEASDPAATFRLLRACTALRLVTYDQDSGRFAGTALLDTLRRESPNSMRNLALLQTAPAHWLTWGRFTDSVRAGSTTSKPRSDVELVADIGGANGAFVYGLLVRNPKLYGIVFNLPTTLPGARADAERLGLGNRSSTIAGDFFLTLCPPRTCTCSSTSCTTGTMNPACVFFATSAKR